MVAALMELTNAMQRQRDAGPIDRGAWGDTVRLLVLMMAPACPHIAEELWERTGHEYSVHLQSWPEPDRALLRRETVEIPVQVNGRVRDRIEVSPDATEAEARSAAEASARVAEHLAGHEVARVVYVPGRLLNIVVR
jgi:leucyl-tRNA synthetase